MVVWALGILLLLPLLAAPIGLFLSGRDRLKERQWGGAVGNFLGFLLVGGVWLAAVGYLGLRAYLAMP